MQGTATRTIHQKTPAPLWDRRFMQLACTVATWSKDPSTQVGAVIVDEQRRVLGLGYNGFPRGIKDTDERLQDRPMKYKLVVHAEVNAILNAIRPPAGATLYCTLFPCNDCAKIIIQSGITCVVAPKPEPGRWDDAHKLAAEMFTEAGVEVFWLETSL
jgi:dCMP deaminase